MEALKELIRLYNLTDNKTVKYWLKTTFENAKMDVFVTCSDAEIKQVQALLID